MIHTQLTILFSLVLPSLVYLGISGFSYLIVLLPLLIALLLKRKLSTYLAHILNFLFIIILSLEFFHLTIYETLPTPGVYIALFETDWKESWEFIQTQNLRPFSLGLFILSIIGYVSYRWMPRLNRKVVISLTILVVAINIVSFQSILTKSPLRLVTYYLHYQNERADFRERLRIQKNSPIDLQTVKNHNQNTVIFVLGESTTKNRMSAYGYPRDTTPLLNSDKDLIKFNNVISPHTETYNTLRKVFTLMNHDNPRPRENIHLINLAKASGYKTFWISNQKSLGKFENPHSIIARDAHEVYWLNDALDMSSGQYDERTIKSLEKVLRSKAAKKFIVIHLLGAHAKYDYRYPEKFDHFKDKVATKLKLTPDQATVYNQYDNAILYQDFVISSLLNRIEMSEKNFSFIYFPDHGEEAYQDDYLVGHSEAKATRNMYEIPMFFKSTDMDLMEVIKDQVNKLWSIEDFIHPLHTLLGVRTQYYQSERDIFSNTFIETDRNVGKRILIQKKRPLLGGAQ